MEIRARYVLVGLFTLAVILGGFGFVYWLQNAGGLGKRTNYDIQFSNTVSGLLKGSAVLFDGIRVGEVTGLRLVPENPRIIKATISIDENTPVRTDTLVSLEFQGLTGVAAVTLTGGSDHASAPATPQGGRPLLIASEGAGELMSESARRVLGCSIRSSPTTRPMCAASFRTLRHFRRPWAGIPIRSTASSRVLKG